MLGRLSVPLLLKPDYGQTPHTVASFLPAIPCLGAAPPLIPDPLMGTGASHPLALRLQTPLGGWRRDTDLSEFITNTHFKDRLPLAWVSLWSQLV